MGGLSPSYPLALEVRDRDLLCLPRRDHVPSLIDRTATIQPQILVLSVNQVFFRQIHHPRHLEVEQNTMSARFEFLEEIIQSREFGRINDQSLTVGYP